MNRRKLAFLRLLAIGCIVAPGPLIIPSAARAVIFDGHEHTALGNATVDIYNPQKLVIGNLGSSGQDGVLINLQGVALPGSSFAMDTEIVDLGSLPAGAYLRSTQLGTVGGVPNQVLSTLQVTSTAAGDYQMTADFSHVWDGINPLTIEYRSGGPNGVLVFSETYDGGASPSFYRQNGPETIYVDVQYDPFRFTGGFDWKNGGGGTLLTSARGVPLPAGVDFLDVFAPSSVASTYSSIQMTGGGGLNSFTLVSEVVSVPEPSTLALASVVGFAATAQMGRRRRKSA